MQIKSKRVTFERVRCGRVTRVRVTRERVTTATSVRANETEVELDCTYCCFCSHTAEGDNGVFFNAATTTIKERATM